MYTNIVSDNTKTNECTGDKKKKKRRRVRESIWGTTDRTDLDKRLCKNAVKTGNVRNAFYNDGRVPQKHISFYYISYCVCVCVILCSTACSEKKRKIHYDYIVRQVQVVSSGGGGGEEIVAGRPVSNFGKPRGAKRKSGKNLEMKLLKTTYGRRGTDRSYKSCYPPHPLLYYLYIRVRT